MSKFILTCTIVIEFVMPHSKLSLLFIGIWICILMYTYAIHYAIKSKFDRSINYYIFTLTNIIFLFLFNISSLFKLWSKVFVEDISMLLWKENFNHYFEPFLVKRRVNFDEDINN